MWIRIPSLFSVLTDDVKTIVQENGIDATRMSICLDVSTEDALKLIEQGFNVRGEIHDIECDSLKIELLQTETNKLMEHGQRCEAYVVKLQNELSCLRQRLSAYEIILD